MMPDLITRGMSYCHTQASAMESLLASGVPESKILFRREARGGLPGLVVGQFPEPGAPHENVDRVVVTISGFGFFHDLPFGMRLDAEDEDKVSTSDLLALFDSEVIRFNYWRDESPLLFGIGPDRHDANDKWMRLFGIDPELWPAEKHFDLCCLLPGLYRTAGTEEGVRLVLSKLLDVEIAEFRFRRAFCDISEDDRNVFTVNREEKTRGARNLQLGLNALVGRRIEGVRSCELRIGPISLSVLRRLSSSEGKRQLRQAFDLCMPVGQTYGYSFVVGDPSRHAELGCAARNSVLGRNSHLGREPWPVVDGSALENSGNTAWSAERSNV